MKKLLLKLGIITLIISGVITGCRKKEVPTAAPQVSTTGMSAVSGTTATGGGSIISDGGTTIIASGLCYSKINQAPSISDDTTKTLATSGSFSSMLKNLQPSATYYLRAYATNSIGTGYGEVVTFTTGNGAPTATTVSVTGIARIGEELTAAYTYSDPENNPQGETTFQWYIATSATGTGEVAIAGATTSKYKIKATDEFKFIRVTVIPKANAGTINGTEAKSAYVGPIDVEAVTFTYNGQQVTYGVIVSPKTGKKWLDRNIGAKRVAQALDDFQAYGDLFQYGRSADGHQLINWVQSGPPNAGTAVNGVTTTKFSIENPGSSLFCSNPNPPTPTKGSDFDWLSPQKQNLWAAPNYVNNPCPSGWHIPTDEEWAAENIQTMAEGYTDLKLTSAGYRDPRDGSITYSGGFSGGLAVDGRGVYWTTTSSLDGYGALLSGRYRFRTNGSALTNWSDFRSYGYSCRCIKNP